MVEEAISIVENNPRSKVVLIFDKASDVNIWELKLGVKYPRISITNIKFAKFYGYVRDDLTLGDIAGGREIFIDHAVHERILNRQLTSLYRWTDY